MIHTTEAAYHVTPIAGSIEWRFITAEVEGQHVNTVAMYADGEFYDAATVSFPPGISDEEENEILKALRDACRAKTEAFVKFVNERRNG